MTSVHWEKVAAGRYASEYNGHIIQAIRKDGPTAPGDRPYIAIVDRTPIDIGAWSLGQAKTQAIQFVERQAGKAKAERLFTNGAARPAEPPMIPDPVDMLFVQPDSVAVVEVKPEPEPEPVQPEPVQPEPGLVHADPGLVQTLNEPVHQDITPPLAVAGQLAITGKLADGDLLATNGSQLLDTLNALKSALELLREHAELECTVNLPPVLKL